MKYLCFFISVFICGNAWAGFEDSPEWLALGHYQPKVLGGYESSIDKNFFISDNGKNSPKSELDASIALFNSKDDVKKCLYPARYKLLKSKGLIKTNFPNCLEYNKFVDDLRPNGVTLLFTNAYMNNPSSLFGHTLFRVDTKRKGTQLLAHGVNYGADVGEENGVLFAVYGLTGGYDGTFTVKPYYDVINMYNNIENRDIWELNLALSKDELDMFVAHLWEIGQTRTKYYFFSKNCSYLLLEILDAVRPSLQLARKFWFHAIPMDTFKAVAREKGLVHGVNYRPSRQSKIIYQYKQLNQKQKASYSKLIKKDEFDEKGLSKVEQAGVLDTAYQYTQYLNVEGDISREDYRKRSFNLLMLRNKIEEKDNLTPLTKGQSPLDTHESKRVSIGTGFRNGEAFQEIMFRPAYHSLMDNGYGYLKGAEINFLNFAFRHYDNQDKYVLQNFDIVGIKSLSPINEMFFPRSYDLKASIDRVFDGGREEDGYAFNLVMGNGLTYELNDNVWLYGMIDNKVSYGGFLPHNSWAGLGGRVGAYMDFDELKFTGEASKTFATSKFGSTTDYSAEFSYSLSTNQSVALKYMYKHNYGKNISEPMLSYRWHF